MKRRTSFFDVFSNVCCRSEGNDRTESGLLLSRISEFVSLCTGKTLESALKFRDANRIQANSRSP